MTRQQTGGSKFRVKRLYEKAVDRLTRLPAIIDQARDNAAQHYVNLEFSLSDEEEELSFNAWAQASNQYHKLLDQKSKLEDFTKNPVKVKWDDSYLQTPPLA